MEFTVTLTGTRSGNVTVEYSTLNHCCPTRAI